MLGYGVDVWAVWGAISRKCEEFAIGIFFSWAETLLEVLLNSCGHLEFQNLCLEIWCLGLSQGSCQDVYQSAQPVHEVKGGCSLCGSRCGSLCFSSVWLFQSFDQFGLNYKACESFTVPGWRYSIKSRSSCRDREMHNLPLDSLARRKVPWAPLWAAEGGAGD